MSAGAGRMVIADTHAAIWLTQEQKLLSKAALRALVDGGQAGLLAIADITLREIAFLVKSGQVLIQNPLDVYLHYVESRFRVLPISGLIAERSVLFGPAYPKDPADRLIGATAIVYGGALVTKDAKIRASKEVDCVW